MAASACWTESSTARPASPGGSVVEARDVTPVHAPRRSREIDQTMSRIRISAALASSGSPADSVSRPSTAASCSGKMLRSNRNRSASEGSRTRARSPGTPASRPAADSRSSATSARSVGSSPPRRPTALSTGPTTDALFGTSRPEGRRITAMMPHMTRLIPFLVLVETGLRNVRNPIGGQF